MEVATFSWLDYAFFVMMLTSSALVGVYYGFIQKQNTAHDYLLGGKQMNVWSISMSIISSTLSAFTLLSIPADAYKFGIAHALMVPATCLVSIINYNFFLPVFYKLQVTSVYEYLALRFSNKVRALGSLLYAIYMVMFLPIVIYVPALALGQVTNLDIHLITTVVRGICIFYTTLGGMKAVVWTDVIQFGVMLGSMLVVIAVGVWNGDGLGTILQNSSRRKRLDLDFDIDFLKRNTFWAVTIGQIAQMGSYFALGQSSVQKFMSLPSFSTIRTALIWATIGTSSIMLLSVFSGLLLYNKYMDCDPLESNTVKSQDQILPLYVMQEVSFIPGLSGLFISGIFSAGLSTLSAIMNCLAATIYEDFLSPFIPKDTSQKRISQYLKILVVIIGVTSIALVYVVEKLGNLVALTLAFAGVTSGPILGLFVIGMLLPHVTTKGALSGGIVSLGMMTWIIMTSQWYKAKGLINYPALPTCTTGCNRTIANVVNETLANVATTIIPDVDEPFFLYKVSFYWYAMMGLIVTVVIALIVSTFTEDVKPLNKDCISPIMHFLIKDKSVVKPPKYEDAAVLERLNKT